jgi:serine/threonine protein kinase
MGCGSVCCYLLTCGQCGSLPDDSDEEWHEPLLDPLSAPGTDRPVEPRARRPLNTSNMLGLGVRDVTVDYELGELLGEGAFGVVRRCHHRRTGQAFACKTVEKAQLRRRADVEDVRREVQILMVC